jgi:hypothetical protein
MMRDFGGRGWGLVCVLALGSAAGGGLARAASDAESRPRTSQWIERIPTGQTVRIVNPYGDVFARFGGYEDQVEVVATAQRIEPDKPELQVALSHAAAGLNVTVGPAAASARDEVGRAGEIATRDRVDVVVFVPKGATLDVRTVNGSIEAEKVQGNVVASSVKGNIRIRAVTGRVTARTARGRITATLENDVTAEPQELATETGDIEVYLWEDADFSVDLATSGLFGTDFSIAIEHHPLEEPNKRASAIVGRGGPRLTLGSKEGQISLRRLQRGFRIDGPGPEAGSEDRDPD